MLAENAGHRPGGVRAMPMFFVRPRRAAVPETPSGAIGNAAGRYADPWGADQGPGSANLGDPTVAT